MLNNLLHLSTHAKEINRKPIGHFTATPTFLIYDLLDEMNCTLVKSEKLPKFVSLLEIEYKGNKIELKLNNMGSVNDLRNEITKRIEGM